MWVPVAVWQPCELLYTCYLRVTGCAARAVKIIAVDKGFYIPGGTQLYGKFVTLKACMKACALAPSCFSADYNPWLRKCYQHSNYTACNTRKSHSQFVHFSKVPCSNYLQLIFCFVSVVKECFRNIRYDVRFRKLCLDYDVMIDHDCLRYDIYSKFKLLCICLSYLSLFLLYFYLHGE